MEKHFAEDVDLLCFWIPERGGVQTHGSKRWCLFPQPAIDGKFNSKIEIDAKRDKRKIAAPANNKVCFIGFKIWVETAKLT